MSVFNGEAFLAEAVESILAQTFAEFEFLIVDDGSRDGTARILQDFTSRDHRVRVLSQENRGLIASLNRGLAEARGRYVARMDADDIAMPDRFARQVEFLDSHPDIGVVGGAMELIDESGLPLRLLRLSTDPREIEARMQTGCELAHPTVMMRRDLVVGLGGYRSTYRHGEDYDLWLRLIEVSRIANLPDVVLRYRLHLAKVSVMHALAQRESVIMARAASRCRRRGAGDPSDGLDGFPEDFLERFSSAGEDMSRLIEEARVPLAIRALDRGDFAALEQLLRRADRHRVTGTERALLIAALVDSAGGVFRSGRWMQALMLIFRALRLSRSRAIRRIFRVGRSAGTPLAANLK